MKVSYQVLTAFCKKDDSCMDFHQRGNSDNPVEVIQIALSFVFALRSVHIKYTHTSPWMSRLHVLLIFIAEDVKLHLKIERNSKFSTMCWVSADLAS
jgi:hypothetical protein